jgi:preprotein translocase subunit SecB
MSEAGNTPTGSENGADANTAAGVRLVAQYIKDLSFENPMAPGAGEMRPKVELNVGLQAHQTDRDLYEVEMKIRFGATHEEKPVFLVELVYAGLFLLHNIPDEARNQVLLIQAPFLLFPFVRRIVADVTRDGGLALPMLEPIDFAALYQSKAAEMQQGPQDTPHLDA